MAATAAATVAVTEAEVAAVEEEEEEGEEVVRAWREGKTRFARQRLVSRQEFRLKIFVVGVIGCVRSARRTAQILRCAELVRSTTVRKTRKGVLKQKRECAERKRNSLSSCAVLTASSNERAERTCQLVRFCAKRNHSQVGARQ